MYILPAAICIATILCSCLPGSGKRDFEIREIEVSDHSVGANFSLSLQDGGLTLIYPSIDALSLNFLTAAISPDSRRPTLSDTKYLDRISYSPDIEESFGRHIYLHEGGRQHILYVDREAESSTVLKWLSKADTDDTWWTDAFPGLPEPLAAFAEGDGMLTILVSEERSLLLYRLTPEGQPERLASAQPPSGSLQVVGRSHLVRQEEYWACSAYDGRSKRLYLIHPRGEGQDGLAIEAIYASAEIHYSTIFEQRLHILLFDPAEATITLLRRDLLGDTRPFEVVPITLCEGTNSLYLTDQDGKQLFLFDERVTDHRERTTYQLSVLYPQTDGGKYEKLALVEGNTEIQGFTALRTGNTLYVLYLRAGSLTLLSASLEELFRSP
jgi:hypothetical protein